MSETKSPYRVLFISAGNSVRSIMAESLLNHWGGDAFHVCSAGATPSGVVHPMALDLLQRLQLPTKGLRSKSWDEYRGADAPHMDFVFMLGDELGGEHSSVWPGQPITSHWAVTNPELVLGNERERIYAFRRALMELENRIKAIVALRFGALGRVKLDAQLHSIAKMRLLGN